MNNNSIDLQALLQSLGQTYQFCPPVVPKNLVISKPLGRPAGSKNKSQKSTERDPSAFELAEK
ncbi:41326_t:CDS:2 [Gigaspora margarita]|uniref:41326_t:CDS:1 n=1 Tax=Gigaspora margarita TaxID=4874 RepID=A0ABM8VYF4_GIGMA|nr:41326_t:CDS:2 [Gigaspora margarita]